MLYSATRVVTEQNIDNFRLKQLQDLDNEIDWDDLVETVFPHYVASNISRLLVTVESMLRIYFLQQRYSMSAPGVEEALFQVEALREFALIDLDSNAIPNVSCIESFNSLLAEKSLSSKIDQVFNINPLVTQSCVEF